MSDMYFDPTEFDFTSLSDVVIRDEGKAVNAKTNEELDMNQLGGAVDDISDLTGFSPLPKDADEEDQDYNADTSDLEEDESDDVYSVTDYFNSAPDDAVLTIGERSASKAELAEILSKRDEIEESHKVLAYDAAQFNAGTRHITSTLSRLLTGAERQIKHIDEALKNNPDDKQYRYLMQRRYDEKAELQRLNGLAQEFGQLRHEQEEIAIGNHIKNTDQQMLRLMPNWYEVKGQLIGWLSENGLITGDDNQVREFNKTYSVANVKAYLKAMKHDHNLKYVTEKAAKAKAKAPRSTPSAVNANRESSNPNLAAKRAVNNMGSSRQANVNAFAFLKD